MIGIIGAMEKELDLLCETMGEFDTQKTGKFIFHIGKIGGKDVVILRCGIGKVNAAIGCILLIQQFKPLCIINTGSAGGVNREHRGNNHVLQIGDVIISTGLVYHDVDVTAFNYAPGQLPGQPQIFKTDERLVRYAEEAVVELKMEKALPESFHHCRGLIGSGDVFMNKPERIAEVCKVFPHMDAVEMEGAAIAHCCHLFSVPFLAIHALSDIAGMESLVSFTEFLPIASDHSAQIVVRIIKKINH
jgi:adenosylhomocysteine nucleosidase